MNSVRTVTTVHSSSNNSAGPTDSSLDALLDDLQTSVARNGTAQPGIVNGGNTKVYREVVRTVKKATSTPAYTQVEYLAPANTTTVLSERSASPMQSAPGSGVTSYKTVSYEYNTNQQGGDVIGTPTKVTHTQIQDESMRRNITELDSLLVDLNHAQKTGYSVQGSRGRSRSTDVVPVTRGGIDLGLLEPLDVDRGTTTQQHVTRTYNTYHTRESSAGHVPTRYTTTETISKTLPVNRELVYTTDTTSTRDRGARSPSPLRREPSPHAPPRSVHKEVFYETKSTSSGSGRQPRSASTPHQEHRYRDKSPTNQRLQREVYSNVQETRHNSLPRYQEMSPPSQRRHQSPSPSRHQNEVRSYNYSTTSNSSTHTTPRPYRSPSPTTNRSPYVENAPIVELPRRSPSPKMGRRQPTPPTKVTTTVRTYTYELPPGVEPGPGYTVHEPSNDYPHNYQPAKEPEPTVITYKYSSHQSSQRQNNTHEQPRPFPTPSPQPEQNPEPPKQLDELMASFGDTTQHQQVQHMSQQRSAPPPAPAPPAAPPAAPVQDKMNGAAVRSTGRGSSRNVAGPPVYYPPGVELFARKDEPKYMSSKASGEYEMSRESQSKGSSGGGGVVPVCLPVCCAMPCTIM